MSTKIRLQRHGRKKLAYFHIVVADISAPRDGKFIERIGRYNPNTNPATIDIDFGRALNWLQTGAQPTDTCRAILAYKGVLYKNHLANGVKKGALTAEQAEEKFAKWVEEKQSKIEAKKEGLATAKASTRKQRIEAESKVNLARAERIAAKKLAAFEAEAEPTTSEEATPATEGEVETTTE